MSGRVLARRTSTIQAVESLKAPKSCMNDTGIKIGLSEKLLVIISRS